MKYENMMVKMIRVCAKKACYLDAQSVLPGCAKNQKEMF